MIATNKESIKIAMDREGLFINFLGFWGGGGVVEGCAPISTSVFQVYGSDTSRVLKFVRDLLH